MRVYYFTQAKWAIRDINTRRLKVSRFFELNDPFELLAFAQCEARQRAKIRKWADELNAAQGAICFSKFWNDPLMWSHYADRHRGICLGFDATFEIKEISYVPKRLTKIQLQKQEFMAKSQSTKFARWKYEKEVRELLDLKTLIKEEDERGHTLFFRSFDSQLKLVEVIAGPRCCEISKCEIEKAVNNMEVKPDLIKSRLAFQSFKVVKQRIDGSIQRGFSSLDKWPKCYCLPEVHQLPAKKYLIK